MGQCTNTLDKIFGPLINRKWRLPHYLYEVHFSLR